MVFFPSFLTTFHQNLMTALIDNVFLLALLDALVSRMRRISCLQNDIVRYFKQENLLISLQQGLFLLNRAHNAPMETDKPIEIALWTIKTDAKIWTSSKMKMHLQLIMAIYDGNKTSIDITEWVNGRERWERERASKAVNMKTTTMLLYGSVCSSSMKCKNISFEAHQHHDAHNVLSPSHSSV